MSRLTGLACLLSALSAPASAQELRPPTVAMIEQGLRPAVMLAGSPPPLRTLTAEMDRLHVPGVSIAVMHDGVIQWAKGYGVTRADGGPVTPDTLFQAGSISKPVTALAALRLVQRHRLSLDGDVNARLKGWKLPVPPGAPVTLRELLAHRAGTTVHGFPGYPAGAPLPTVEDILAGRAPANTEAVVVDTPPGTAWRYSGGGYTVVQKLIGDVTGRPFAQVLADEVLRPAGMTNSRFAQPLSSVELARAALPHDAMGHPLPGGPRTYPELAAAGLWSTPTDLLHYAVAVRDSAQGKRGALLDQQLATQMLTPGKGDYGLGLEVHGAPDNRDASHGGSNMGYEDFLVSFTGTGDGVAVMTNGAQGNELALEITRSVAAAYDWPRYRTIERASVPIPAATRARLAGTYAIPGLGTFSIGGAADGLTLSLKDGASEPLYAAGPDSFFILSTDLIVQLDPGTTPITGRIVTGPFNMAFRKQD